MDVRRWLTTLLLCAVVAAIAAAPASATAPVQGGGVAAPAQDASPVSAGKSGGASGDSRARQRVARARARSRARAKVRAKARAKARRHARRKRRAPAAPTPAPSADPVEAGHVFPVAGAHDLGGSGARFGAGREGHRHQGQDIAAAEGTPVVAPWAGTVEYVRIQRRGAGWYVVLDGDGEDRDYVFMHLRAGSILVTQGQRVSAGAQLAQVGNTGSSTEPHLHFEIWVGGWYDGGKPVDPLSLLMQWSGRA